MATTGFWPVRGRLKEVIDYANNPDKTTAKEYLDEDLYAAIRYVENDDKTDQTMYVSGINCSKHNAYNEMIAVKRRFGERGKNIAHQDCLYGRHVSNHPHTQRGGRSKNHARIGSQVF